MSLTARFFDLPAELMTALGTVLGFALTGGLTYAQQNSLGNWLELIGQILDTNASQGQLLQANDTSRRLDALERELTEQMAGQSDRRRLFRAVELTRQIRTAARLNANPGQLAGWLCAGMFL